MDERVEPPDDDWPDRRQRDASWDGDAIRRLRRHAGLSQRELAEELNARQQTVSEWERGEYSPRGTAARLLTRVAEDVLYPFGSEPPPAGDRSAAAEAAGEAVGGEDDDWADADDDGGVDNGGVDDA